MAKFRFKPSVAIAGVIAAATAGWLYSGQLDGNQASNETANTTPSPVSQAQAAPTEETERSNLLGVRTIQSEAVTRRTIISLNGRTEANRSVQLKAEINGEVASVAIDMGSYVQAKQKLVSLDIQDKNSRVEYLKNFVKQRELEYEAARKLAKKGFQSETRKAEALANLSEAKADLKAARIALNETVITAPFDGIVTGKDIETGGYVQLGDPVLSIVDLDPLVIAAEVSEQDVGRLQINSAIRAKLITGEDIEAIIKRIQPVANESTRTFRIEAEIPNPDQTIRAGITTILSIPLEEREAHFVSKGILTLDDAGVIGIKTVDDLGIVVFNPVELVEDTPSGVWVAGLPRQATVITVGQEFVTDGQKVEIIVADETQQAANNTGN